eukprot:TRINITY_DN92936_c0_g1_i1.p1 TRINITY_DN92936_c0_g1~~TRINITY_DN92936_c0_g1_i1.p1  ORF type:complete len:242 (+),score=26.94 TRINITY_DN92936_c0_g1_i1:82-807(+)
MIFCGLRPATQCCCGCSLKFGAQVILFLNLIRNVLYILVALDAVTHSETELVLPVAGGSLAEKMAFAAWGVVGLSITSLGLWGTTSRAEQAVRVCVFYLVLECLIDFGVGVYENMIHSSCLDLDTIARGGGRPVVCGVERLGLIICVLAVISAEVFALYIMQSYCDALAGELDSSAFCRLDQDAEAQRLVGKHLHLHPSDLYSFATLEKQNAAPDDSHRIYGSYHDVQYPPIMRDSRGKLV